MPKPVLNYSKTSSIFNLIMDSYTGLDTFKADELRARVLVPGVASFVGGEISQSLEWRVLESAL